MAYEQFRLVLVAHPDGLLQYAFDYGVSLQTPSGVFVTPRNTSWARPAATGSRRARYSPGSMAVGQESNTAPEIPCMQRWLQLDRSVGDFDVLPIKGLIANWYHQGFFPPWLPSCAAGRPTPTGRRMPICWRPWPRDFGPAGPPTAIQGWEKLSEAIGHFPFYYGLSYTMNAGLAQPLWLDPQAVNPRPWRRGFVNSLAPMNMQAQGQGPGSGPENRARLRQLQHLWQEGVLDLRVALDTAPAYAQPRAENHVRMARPLPIRSTRRCDLVAWFDARDRWQHAATDEQRMAALDALARIGRIELTATRQALPMYVRDSRLGYLYHGRGCFTAETSRTRWRP